MKDVNKLKQNLKIHNSVLLLKDYEKDLNVIDNKSFDDPYDYWYCKRFNKFLEIDLSFLIYVTKLDQLLDRLGEKDHINGYKKYKHYINCYVYEYLTNCTKTRVV